jgi:hypothetical protein
VTIIKQWTIHIQCFQRCMFGAFRCYDFPLSPWCLELYNEQWTFCYQFTSFLQCTFHLVIRFLQWTFQCFHRTRFSTLPNTAPPSDVMLWRFKTSRLYKLWHSNFLWIMLFHILMEIIVLYHDTLPKVFLLLLFTILYSTYEM